MKHVVVFGALALVAGFAACGSESKSLHHGGDGDDGAGNAPAGQGPGGEVSGGVVGTGGAGTPGGQSGRGGSPSGGTGTAGSGGGATGGVGGAGAAGKGGGAGVPCGSYDCTLLPGVRPGAVVECVADICVIPPEACAEGFAHCSTNLNVGCESNLHTSTTCASCETSCNGLTPACTLGPNGWHCSEGCEAPTPDKCGTLCTNFDTDAGNCGGCRNDCSAHTVGACVAGQCARSGSCDSHYGDCTDAPGCETEVTTADDCGACGRNDCGANGTTVECSSPTACVPPTCIAGYANCDRTNVDCEVRIGATCVPTALPPITLAVDSQEIAIADGGAVFVVGAFGETVDFDPTSGTDPHTSAGGDSDGYITRFDANGAYAWTRTFGGESMDYPHAVAVGRDGSLFVGGFFNGPTDLDPGPGTDPHTSDGDAVAFVSKFTAAGAFVWARELGDQTISALAGDASGAVYVVGTFFIPAAAPSGAELAVEGESGTFLVKLTAAGTIGWEAPIEGEDYEEWMSVAVALDGSVWAVGRQTPPATLLGRSLGVESGMVVAGFEAAGTVRTLWSPGVVTDVTERAFVGAGTNVHVSGKFERSLDVDPGSAVATRWTLHSTGRSGVGVALGANGTYQSAHVFEEEPRAIQDTPGGGTLVLLPVDPLEPNSTPNLVSYYADGTPAWSLRTPADAAQPRLVASTTHFAVAAFEPPLASPSQAKNGVPSVSVVRRYAF